MSQQTTTTSQSAQVAAQQASFKVGEMYQVVDVVGEGAYGVVW